MTVVLGRRFEDAICIASDTMISETDRGQQNGIPGRLKIISLDSRFSVAYAGHANQALDTIRKASAILTGHGSDTAISYLREATTKSAPADFEFIVARHCPDAELLRIWDGKVSANLDQTAIGDARIRDEVNARFDRSRDRSIRDYQFAFISAFTDRKVHLGAGVGGFPICLFADAQGHSYRGHSFNQNWKPIVPVWGTTTYEDENDLLTGDWSFHHSVFTIGEPGVALLGVEVPQAKLGYVYAPMLEDEPSQIKLLDDDKMWTQHQAEIHNAMREALDNKLKIIKSPASA